MPREFSLAHLTLLSFAPPELIEIAARAGYDFVGLRPIAVTPNEPKYPLHQDKELLKRTKRKLSDTGIRVLDIELARILDGVNIKDYEPALAASAELGSRYLLSSIWSDDRAFAQEKFEELCALAKPYGLTVCLEFVTFASLTNLAEAAGMVEAARCSNSAICVDTLHFFRSNCATSELRKLPQSWFPYLQICDAPKHPPATRKDLIFTARAERKFLGDGGLPIADVINALPQVPYAIELPNLALSIIMSPLAFARYALTTANDYLDAHPRSGKRVHKHHSAKAAA
jgi:sugar phosphate isomerase/epimerase